MSNSPWYFVSLRPETLITPTRTPVLHRASRSGDWQTRCFSLPGEWAEPWRRKRKPLRGGSEVQTREKQRPLLTPWLERSAARTDRVGWGSSVGKRGRQGGDHAEPPPCTGLSGPRLPGPAEEAALAGVRVGCPGRNGEMGRGWGRQVTCTGSHSWRTRFWLPSECSSLVVVV